MRKCGLTNSVRIGYLLAGDELHFDDSLSKRDPSKPLEYPACLKCIQ